MANPPKPTGLEASELFMPLDCDLAAVVATLPRRAFPTWPFYSTAYGEVIAVRPVESIGA
jgi:hypothetical protein